MKKIVTVLGILFVFIANDALCSDFSRTEWREGVITVFGVMSVTVNDNDEIFMFTKDSCYISYDLGQSCEAYVLPEKGDIYETFWWKGHIYMSTNTGLEVGNLWRSQDGITWELSFDRYPMSLVANDQTIFFFSSKIQKNWKSDNGSDWTELDTLNTYRKEFNNDWDAVVDYARVATCKGSRVVVFSNHLSDITTDIFSSDDNGESWSHERMPDVKTSAAVMNNDGKYTAIGGWLHDQHPFLSFGEVPQNNFVFGRNRTFVNIWGIDYTTSILRNCAYLGDDYWVAGSLYEEGAQIPGKTVVFRNGDISNAQIFDNWGSPKMAGNDSLLVIVPQFHGMPILLLGGHTPVIVDTTKSTILSLVVSDDYITELDTGNAAFNMTVTFNEGMNTNIDPTIVFNPSLVNNLINCVGVWSEGGTIYTYTCDVELVNIDSITIDVNVSEAQDLAGNIMIPDTISGVNKFSIFIDTTIPIDTTKPTISLLGVNDDSITELDVGVDAFEMFILFNETMDMSIYPIVTYNPGMDTVLTNCTGVWSGGSTFTYTCDVESINIDSTIINISVSDAQDLAGNTMIPDTTSGIDKFSIYIDITKIIDTTRPTILSLDVSDDSITDSDVGMDATFNVNITFDEPMDTVKVPIVIFDPIVPILTNCNGTWDEEGMVYIYTCDVISINETVELDNVSVYVSSAKDTTGNVMKTDLSTGVNMFSVYIDTITAIENPFDILEPYPNPTSDYINFQVKGGSGEVILVDMYGRKVREENFPEGRNSLDVFGLRSGVYVLLLNGEGKRIIVKQ